MKTLDEYVEANLNHKSAECEFIAELCRMINLDLSNIKGVEIKNIPKDTKVVQVVQIRLRGSNRFSADDISKISGFSIITPNLIEIEVGEIHL